MRIWLIIIAGGLVTYGSRVSFIAFGDKISLPKSIEKALAYVAPAAFAGISVPLVLGGDGLTNIVADIPEIAAALTAIGAVWWKRSIPLSIISAMSVLLVLEWLL